MDTDALERDKTISKQLVTDKKRLANEMRLLLLGAGESGKSTIAKQMKILHMGGFNPEEKLEFIALIHANTYESVQNIMKASHVLDINLSSKESVALGEEFMQPFSTLLTPDLAERIEAFYKDEGVLRIISRRSEFQLLDNTPYYAQNVRRICAKGYIPSEQDILHSRAQTTGVIETSFMVEGKKFIMVDVGGQRSERKKWMHCFENVSGVLFCVGISAFDQTLYEDNVTNRLHEALKLFHEICGSKWFSATAIILFLNKEDIFREKLAKGKSISVAFPEFTGGSDYDASVKFLVERFTDVNDPITEKRKEIYHHVTTATDTHNVQLVFTSVRDFVTTEALRKCGLVIM